ncbi:uncharacterized protein LOC129284547 [Prosopis cineraria]|uniref:uncharacterized protein LOC129284547 n=1 Tax=Prosopis cineraria TaxID=364024 RepID=UPI00240F10F3|nr:uncharacterized protein LOC129284547 [Prosopis cineraria]
MAILASCSDTPTTTGTSPRISFSNDLNRTAHEDHTHRTSDLCHLDSPSDFVFCVAAGAFPHQISSADELFSNGKILPMQIHKVPQYSSNITQQSLQSPHLPSQSHPSSSSRCSEKKRLKEFLAEDIDEEDDDEVEEEEEEDKVSFKSLWQFRRSSSLNCDTRGISLIRSLHFLSRSNSTGSALNPKQTEISKEAREKQRLQKQSSVSSRRSSSSSSSSSSSTYYFYSSSRKHFLQKNRGSSGNGVRISPVLNLPQAYIPKGSMSFFGFGSLFCNGKVKKKKK